MVIKGRVRLQKKDFCNNDSIGVEHLKCLVETLKVFQDFVENVGQKACKI